tara:strand:+ start:49 stop:261 length:213 start_codon:yes stop_codon:yes gene_type:complete
MNKTQQLAEAKQNMKKLGITINYHRDWQEYRVNFKNGQEPTAYYTNDIEDAVGTGFAMAMCRNVMEGPRT